MTDDLSLITAYTKHGDSAAFEALYNKYFRQIYGAVYMRTHHRETTEEIVSQTFLQALERLQSFKSGRGSFAGWLHQIARNLVVDHYRALRPQESFEDAWDLPDDTDVQRDADTALRIASVREKLASLKPKQRDIILLRVWYQYSFAEIAAATGTTEAACKMGYKRSMDTLRSMFIFLLLFFPVLLS